MPPAALLPWAELALRAAHLAAGLPRWPGETFAGSGSKPGFRLMPAADSAGQGLGEANSWRAESGGGAGVKPGPFCWSRGMRSSDSWSRGVPWSAPLPAEDARTTHRAGAHSPEASSPGAGSRGRPSSKRTRLQEARLRQPARPLCLRQGPALEAELTGLLVTHRAGQNPAGSESPGKGSAQTASHGPEQHAAALQAREGTGHWPLQGIGTGPPITAEITCRRVCLAGFVAC